MSRMEIVVISCIFISCCSLPSKSRVLDDVATDALQEWQIAVVKETLGGQASIDILDSQGRQIKTITEPGRTWSLTWSSEGHHLAFMSDRHVAAPARVETTNDPFYQPPGHLFVIKLTDGQLTQITDGAYKTWLPRLSSDGQHIAFLSDQQGHGDLYLSPTQNPFVTRLTKDKNWPLEGPLWLSPSEIMYNSFVDNTLEVFRMNVIDHASERVQLGAPQHSKAGYLAVSHDRKRLAFDIRDRELDAKKGIINPQLYVINLHDGHRQRLTFDESVSYAPSWSPDDKWIAFLRQVETKDGPRANLYVIGDDGKSEKLVATTVTSSSPKWQSYTNVIVYTAYAEQKNGLYLFDLNSGKTTRIGGDEATYRDPTTREMIRM